MIKCPDAFHCLASVALYQALRSVVASGAEVRVDYDEWPKLDVQKRG